MHTDLAIATIANRKWTGWHVLYTRHQHEKGVSRVLANKGFETFLPLCRTASRWKDRNKLIDRPLFPCYVFIRGVGSEWLNVLKTPGVYMVVPGGDGPAIVPEEEIDAVRRLIQSGGIVEPHPFLKFGDRVRVKSGPLAETEGFLIRKKSLCRLVVCIEILGKAAATEIDAVLVERVSEQKWREPSARDFDGRVRRKQFGSQMPDTSQEAVAK
ncbi:MAG: UpxY family transcription antiterminator [Candidatus Acidiferrales bacterium]